MAKKNKKKTTSIGGQAVIEGVMMMGKTACATAVRDPDGEIQIESQRLNSSKGVKAACKIPFVRGAVNMVLSLSRGMKTLMRSADVFGEDEEEPSRFEKWLTKKFNCDLMSVISTISVILGVLLAVGLFIVAPLLIVSWIKSLAPSIGESVWEYVIQGAVKFVIFLAYLGLILLMPSMRRMYQYHGAEHKTINCYESGKELTVENVMASSRIHDRCGTSFMFIILLINVVIISLVYWALGVQKIENGVLQYFAKLGVEVVLLPVITGVGYEVLKLLAKFHGKISKIFKSPGMLMQKVFTTREPAPEMVEVAIAAFNRALEMDADPELPETRFVTGGMLAKKLEETKKLFAENNIDESDAEWIYSILLDIPRSELGEMRIVKPSESKKIEAVIQERLTGKPLWYIIGDVDFYGCKIKVDERALIPRPETELLAEAAAQIAEEGDKILDMCTGSGCIAVSVAKKCEAKKVSVTAVDISEAAIMLAKENAELNEVNVNFVQSNLFEKVRGKYNVIVCNPPYVPTREIKTLAREVKDFEPRLALDGGDDGLDFYRRIARDIKKHMARGGMLILEYGEGQLEDILQLFPKREYFIPMKDFSGTDRFVKIAF